LDVLDKVIEDDGVDDDIAVDGDADDVGQMVDLRLRVCTMMMKVSILLGVLTAIHIRMVSTSNVFLNFE